MKKILLLLFLIAVPAFLFAQEPVREWKSKSGKTVIEASLDVTKDSDDPKMVYFLKEGKRYQYPFEKLSQSDQEYVTRVRSGGRDIDADASPAERNPEAFIVPSGKRYALLIGVNRYAKPIKSLQYCVKDVELLAECFQRSGMPRENIILVTDDSPFERRPTGGNIRRQIDIITSLMDPDDQLVVAFCGHGVMVDGKSYLCPSDTDLKDKKSIISRDWVFEQLELCQAKQKVFIIDACRSEIAYDGGKTIGQVQRLEDPIGADTHGFILIASCDKKQQSWENLDLQHGVFTYFLAQGLSGEAKDEDGYVTIMGLFQYASYKTKKFVFSNYRQTQAPTFRQGDEMTDFSLARVNRYSHSGSPDDQSVSETFFPQTLPEPLEAGRRLVCKVNGVELAFRYCPPGTFTMGSPEDEPGRLDDETQHIATLSKGFWMLETEVTVGMFRAFVDDMGYESNDDSLYGGWEQGAKSSWRRPGFIQDDNHPVTCVSWNDAVEFCKWLSRKTGQNITLPTETQWEYACRAGTKGPYAGALDEMAWYNNVSGATHPVKTKKPNGWGLYDMHGNVWEWCQDWKTDYPNGSVTDPIAPSIGSHRIIRGGGWGGFAGTCRSSFRNNCDPEKRNNDLGFRCVINQSN